MRSSIRSFGKTSFVAVVAVVCLAPQVARAQKASVAKLSEEVAKLRLDVELVKQAAVQVPTLATAVKELDAKLAVIETEIGTLKRAGDSAPDVVHVIDSLNVRVESLENAVNELRTNLAEVERPGVASTGGGGGATTRKGSFSWATEDGAYAIKIGGYGQFRFQLGLPEGVDDVDEATFRIRRARLAASGHLGSEDLQFKILFDTIESESQHDFYVDYKIIPELWLRAGQWKKQFIRNFSTSSRDFAFMERSAFVEDYRYDRDMMVALHGKALDDRLGYYASFGNGSGRNQLNDNIDFAPLARLEYAIVGKLPKHAEGDWKGSEDMSVVITVGGVHDLVALPDEVAGIAVNNDVDANDEIDNVRVISVTAGAAFRFKGISATAEWVLRRESYGRILDAGDNADFQTALNTLGGAGDTRNYQGFYVQGTYMVMPKQLMLGARVARHRNTLLGIGGRTHDTVPIASRTMQIDVLAQLYDDRVQGRFVGLMYSFFDHNANSGSDPAADKQHRVILETQVKF